LRSFAGKKAMQTRNDYKFQHEADPVLKNEAELAHNRNQWIQCWELVRSNWWNSLLVLLVACVCSFLVAFLSTGSGYSIILLWLLGSALKHAMPGSSTQVKDIKVHKGLRPPQLVRAVFQLLLLGGIAVLLLGFFSKWRLFGLLPFCLVMATWDCYQMVTLKKKMIKWGLIDQGNATGVYSSPIAVQLSEAETVIDSAIAPLTERDLMRARK